MKVVCEYAKRLGSLSNRANVKFSHCGSIGSQTQSSSEDMSDDCRNMCKGLPLAASILC